MIRASWLACIMLWSWLLMGGILPVLSAPVFAAETPSSAASATSFGKKVSFAILQDYPKGENLDDVRDDFKLMKELGVTTWRGSFSWIDYEPKRGAFDVVWLRKFLDLAVAEGITLRPYLGYTPAWAARGGSDKEVWNDPPRRIDDWRRFVTKMATETRSYRNIASFEIYNEENVKQWWDGKASDYNLVLRTAAVAVKSVVPATDIIFGGMVYPDGDWLEAACTIHQNGKFFDILPIHAYPETWTPKNITVENYLDHGHPGSFKRDFLPVLDRKCLGQPLWLNEVGFATAPGKSERDQANWWARALATFLADPRIEHIGIYQIRDRKKTEQVIGEGENYYLGLLRADRSPKMAYHLLRQLLPLLNSNVLTVADDELAVEVVAGDKVDLYRHLFVRPDGRQVLFVWDKGGNPTLRLRPRPGSQVIEHHLDGSSSPYTKYDRKSLDEVVLSAGAVRIFEVRQ